MMFDIRSLSHAVSVLNIRISSKLFDEKVNRKINFNVSLYENNAALESITHFPFWISTALTASIRIRIKKIFLKFHNVCHVCKRTTCISTSCANVLHVYLILPTLHNTTINVVCLNSNIGWSAAPRSRGPQFKPSTKHEENFYLRKSYDINE